MLFGLSCIPANAASVILLQERKTWRTKKSLKARKNKTIITGIQTGVTGLFNRDLCVCWNAVDRLQWKSFFTNYKHGAELITRNYWVFLRSIGLLAFWNNYLEQPCIQKSLSRGSFKLRKGSGYSLLQLQLYALHIHLPLGLPHTLYLAVKVTRLPAWVLSTYSAESSITNMIWWGKNKSTVISRACSNNLKVKSSLSPLYRSSLLNTGSEHMHEITKCGTRQVS